MATRGQKQAESSASYSASTPAGPLGLGSLVATLLSVSKPLAPFHAAFGLGEEAAGDPAPVVGTSERRGPAAQVSATQLGLLQGYSLPSPALARCFGADAVVWMGCGSTSPALNLHCNFFFVCLRVIWFYLIS